DKPTIAILGGTGDLGSGLAKCWLAAGYKVVLGSRSAEKAKSVAEAMTGEVAGDDNVGAARAGDIVVLAVPFASHDATLTEVK
ncbi:NAD(P)-binding domain-containing protein, partial [Escherichia coli]|nr:NAD(P)-binding domain-containing protein [Escherichia coli]